MPPAEVIAFHTKVVRMGEEKRTRRATLVDYSKPPTPENTQVEEENLGWFVVLEGSHEKLFVGKDKPGFAVGDRIKVTMAKA